MIYYQGDILEESDTGKVYVVSGHTKDGLELLPGRMHPRSHIFVQEQDVVPVKVSWSPTGYRKIGVAISFLPGSMVLK